MPALSHIGLGLTAKRVAPQTSGIVLVLAALAWCFVGGDGALPTYSVHLRAHLTRNCPAS